MSNTKFSSPEQFVFLRESIVCLISMSWCWVVKTSSRSQTMSSKLLRYHNFFKKNFLRDGGISQMTCFSNLNSQLDQKILFSKTWKCYFDEKIPFGPNKILPSKFQVRGMLQRHQQCKLKIDTNCLTNWQRSIWASDSASEASDWWNEIKPLTSVFTAVPAFV